LSALPLSLSLWLMPLFAFFFARLRWPLISFDAALLITLSPDFRQRAIFRLASSFSFDIFFAFTPAAFTLFRRYTPLAVFFAPDIIVCISPEFSPSFAAFDRWLD